jgi:hypothetical protein
VAEQRSKAIEVCLDARGDEMAHALEFIGFQRVSA